MFLLFKKDEDNEIILNTHWVMEVEIIQKSPVLILNISVIDGFQEPKTIRFEGGYAQEVWNMFVEICRVDKFRLLK